MTFFLIVKVFGSLLIFLLCDIGVSLKFVTSIKAIYNTVKVCFKSLGKLSQCFEVL